MLQAVVPAVYPIIKDKFHLTFSEIGLITLTYQLTASILQPFVGFYTDKKPRPYSLAVAMVFTLIGLAAVAVASSFTNILLAVSLIGIGSSYISSRSFESCASGFRRKKRIGAIYFSIRRKCRKCHRAFACSYYCSALRAV